MVLRPSPPQERMSAVRGRHLPHVDRAQTPQLRKVFVGGELGEVGENETTQFLQFFKIAATAATGRSGFRRVQNRNLRPRKPLKRFDYGLPSRSLARENDI